MRKLLDANRVHRQKELRAEVKALPKTLPGSGACVKFLGPTSSQAKTRTECDHCAEVQDNLLIKRRSELKGVASTNAV